jgi:hypothetical protein
MMLFALMLAAQVVQARPEMSAERSTTGMSIRTADQAEEQFAADARMIGQWAAFRKWAAPDAILFDPEATPARVVLRDLPEPREAVLWAPEESLVSCDGGTAANTGPTRWPDGRVGYFSTIWARQADGAWRWKVDHGDFGARPGDRPRYALRIRRASCEGRPPAVMIPRGSSARFGTGESADRTLRWSWTVAADGARTLDVWLWNGRAMVPVLADRVAAPRR